jgi:putative endonuclease
MLRGAFQPPGPARVFPRRPGTGWDLAATGAYFNVLSHTGKLYISVASNLYLRIMQHKEGKWVRFHCDLRLQAPEAKPSPGKNNAKAWRRSKMLNLICGINPEFKDLAQTWGWKMIRVHEQMYP